MNQWRYRIERLKTGEVVATVDTLKEAYALWWAEAEARETDHEKKLSMAFYLERVDA